MLLNMKHVIHLFAFFVAFAQSFAAPPATGQFLFQRKTAGPFDQFGVTPVTGQAFGWDGSNVVMLPNSGGGGTWGSITGTLSSQTDLQSALNAKLSLAGVLPLAGFSGITGTLPLTNLGATTVGGNILTLANPSAISFLRLNANNTVDALSASLFRSAIGAGTGSGTVTAVSVATANGISGTSSGGATPALTLSLGAITPESVTTGADSLAGDGTFSLGGNTLFGDGSDINVTHDLYVGRDIVMVRNLTSGAATFGLNPEGGWLSNANIVIGDGANVLRVDGSFGLGGESVIGDGTNLTLTGALNLGHATDTQVARVSPGVISVAGNTVITDSNLTTRFAADSAADPKAGTFTSITQGQVQVSSSQVVMSNGFSLNTLDAVSITVPRVFIHNYFGDAFVEIQNSSSLSGTSGASQLAAISGVMSVRNDGDSTRAILLAGTTFSIVGTTAGGNATAGNVGEYVAASVVQGSATALTTATPKTVTSITLTAGDWDITAIGALTGASTGTVFDVAIGTTTNSVTGTIFGDTRAETPTVSLTGADATLMIPAVRVSISGSTTYYLIVSETFTIGSPSAYGRISARRIR